MFSQPQCCINKIFTLEYYLLHFRSNISAEPTVRRCSALSKKQIRANRSKTQMLVLRAYVCDEHKTFKEHMENNPEKQNFGACLKYGMELVVDGNRTMSEAAPTMITLLQNGAKWGRITKA